MKPMVRYQMNFSGKGQAFSAFFAGVAFFAIVIHAYVLGNFEAMQGAAAFWGIYAPLAVLGIYMLLTRLIRLDFPPVYAGVALLYFLVLSVQNFTSGGPQWINILETVLHVLCVVALAFSALGYIPGKWYIAFALLLCVAGRFWFRDFMGYLKPLALEASLPELARLCGVLSMSCMCFGLKPKYLKKRNAERA